MIAATSKTIFLINVCVLVRCMASPKQPQSCIGLLTVNHNVTAVITAMKSKEILLANRRRMAKRSITPSVNSMAERAIDTISCAQSGT